MTDALDSTSKVKPASASERLARWVTDNVWAPTENNLLAPIGNVGVQAANALHLTDGINLVKHATNDLGITRAVDSEKIKPFYVPEPHSLIQRTVQDMSATAGSVLLYTMLARGTSKLLGGTSSLLASGELRATTGAELRTASAVPSFTQACAKATSVLAKEQNALLIGATAYNAARDPEPGETRAGNAAGALAQFGVYRIGYSRWSSSFGEEAGVYNKLVHVVLPRATIGIIAGLTQSVVSNSVSDSINTRRTSLSMGNRWHDNLGMSAAMNVILPSVLAGKASDGRMGERPAGSSKPAVITSVDFGEMGPAVEKGIIRRTINIVDPDRLGRSAETIAVTEAHEPAHLINFKVGDKVGRVGGTNPEIPGMIENDLVKRLIIKPSGTRVIVFESGRVALQEPGKTPVMITREGRRIQDADEKDSKRNDSREDKIIATTRVKEQVAPPDHREKPQPPDFSHLPENERPVNVGSGNGELIAKEMSNFEQSPFVIDGRKFQSVEGFYVWLKFSGAPEKQSVAQNLYSYEAKKFGKQSSATTANYDGKEMVLGSEEHHALIKRAVQAKLEQHPDIARRFAETYPRSIIHDLGYPEAPSRLPAAAFSTILTELRDGLVKGDIVTIDGTTAELSAKAAAREAAKPKMPISDALRKLEGRPQLQNHPLERYARALENSGIQVVQLRGVGGDHLAFEIPNNQILKISTSTFPHDFVPRQFHLHITEPQIVDAGGGLKLQLYKQPIGETPVTPQQYRDFKEELARQGWVLTDGAEDQLSLYNGGIKLHDPFAAQKAPPRTK